MSINRTSLAAAKQTIIASAMQSTPQVVGVVPSFIGSLDSNIRAAIVPTNGRDVSDNRELRMKQLIAGLYGAMKVNGATTRLTVGEAQQALSRVKALALGGGNPREVGDISKYAQIINDAIGVLGGRSADVTEYVVTYIEDIASNAFPDYPVISQSPTSEANVTGGATHVLSSDFIGTGTPKWYFLGEGDSDYRAIDDGATYGGTDTVELTINAMSAATAGNYQVRVQGTTVRADSEVAIIGLA